MRLTDMADELYAAAADLPGGVRTATARRGGVTVTRVDLAASGVLLDDTLSASLVDRGNSSQDGCVLVSGIRIDGSVCLLDDCFQVGLNGLVVSLLCSSLRDTVLLRFDVRHSFHLLGYL